MAIARTDADLLLHRPGVAEAIADWEKKKRRPGELVRSAERCGATLSDAEAETLEFQSVLRQLSELSARAVRLRR